MSDDPFLQVQADVLSLLDTTRPIFSSYLRIRSSASSPSNPQLVEARQELESNLTDLSTDLQDLIDSVKAVEGDPYKYGIDIDEVSRRRKLVEDVGEEIEDMHRQLNRTVDKASLAHPDSFGAAEGEEDDDMGVTPSGDMDEDMDSDEDASRDQTPDVTKMTKRQRALINEEGDGALLALSNEAQKKKHLTAEEHAMRRAEMARRRKNLSEKRNEEEKVRPPFHII